MKRHTTVQSLSCSQGETHRRTDAHTDGTTAALLYPHRNALLGDNKRLKGSQSRKSVSRFGIEHMIFLNPWLHRSQIVHPIRGRAWPVKIRHFPLSGQILRCRVHVTATSRRPQNKAIAEEVTKRTDTSYYFDKVCSGEPDGRFGKWFLIK